MKIKYDLTKERFKYYNMAHGIFMRKNILKKHSNKKLLSYTNIGFHFLIVTILLFFVGAILIGILDLDKYIEMFSTIISILFSIIIFYYVYFLISYMLTKNNIAKGTLVVDKEGISDISDDKVTIKFGWDKIELIVVKNNEIVVISSYLLIIAKTQDEEQFISTVKKYNDEILLIVE